MNNSNNNNNDNNDNDKMAKLFYDMYISCLKYKVEKAKQNSNKKIDCDEYYNQLKFFNEKYFNKEQNN